MPSKKHNLFLPFSGLLIALIFATDALTPLGYAEWTLYVVPVALCLFVGQVAAPLVAAIGCSALLAVGYFMSPDGADSQLALVNRILGAIGFWVVAIVGSRFISARREIERLTWLERGKALVASRIAGVQTPAEIGSSVLAAFVEYTGCPVGVFYRKHGDRMMRIAATALAGAPPAELPLGSTLAGQSAADGVTRIIGPLAETYLEVGSALGRMQPRAVVVAPTLVDGEVNGLMEFAYLEEPRELALVRELLASCSSKIGVALAAALSRIRLQELLAETQHQHEELQTQQEELRASNKELDEQGSILKESKAQLERQQEELEQSNVQLEEYSNHLERQRHELLVTQRTLKENAEALERTNQYKSEFLANMSHELRTPLNSSLILSRLLADNADGSLSEVQVRYAKTIQASNHDLLNLINDILDLSKIESGKVETTFEPVALSHLLEPLRLTFEPIAGDARLGFRIEVAPDVPEAIVTDLLRVQQILRNLLSNAFKFTRSGEVVLGVRLANEREVHFCVRDTGIGIAEDQQQVIFEAFRQADGSTSRQFGGTGLGLSISRELARLLQGSITVVSAPSQGSTFTLCLPLAPDLPESADEEVPTRVPGASPDGPATVGDRLSPSLPGFSELKEAMDALTEDGLAADAFEPRRSGEQHPISGTLTKADRSAPGRGAGGPS